MAYIFTKHIISTDVGVVLFHLKATLVTAGWIVKSSSDGTTFNTTGDQISLPGSGAGGFSNSNAWARIQMPSINGVTREFTFQRTNSAAYIMKYSYSAGFITGGSASATPTATDQQSSSGATLLSSDVGVLIAQTEAPYGFVLAAYRYNNLNSGTSGGILFEPILPGSGPVGDLDPYIIGTGGLDRNMQSATSFGCWFNKGEVNETYQTIVPNSIRIGTSNTLFPSGANIDQITGKLNISHIPWIRIAGSAGAIGFKGLGSMMMWNGIQTNAGETFNLNSYRDRIALKNVNFPWDGTLPLIR